MSHFKAKMHHSVSLDPLPGFRGPTSKGREGKDRGEEGREGGRLRHGFLGDDRPCPERTSRISYS